MSSSLDKILYVEDDTDIQTIARMALEAVGGFEVKICSSGDEALVEAPGFAPDLVLLDVMMPNMDGPTTLRKLREMDQFAATPVVFMTAKIMDDEIEDYKAMGALDVISKPFDSMTHADRVRGIWQQADG